MGDAEDDIYSLIENEGPIQLREIYSKLNAWSPPIINQVLRDLREEGLVKYVSLYQSKQKGGFVLFDFELPRGRN